MFHRALREFRNKGLTIVFLILILDTGLTAPAWAQVRIPKSMSGNIGRSVDIPYADGNANADSFRSLDIYQSTGAQSTSAQNAPVMIYIHGGGWQNGDKRGVGSKPTYFNDLGYVFVSLNYRLIPSVSMQDQLQDSATAIAWVHSHIAKYGGDPERIAISGHSAGAHHVAILSTNERFLKTAGKDLSIIKTALIIDTQALDVESLMNERESKLYRQAFGNDRNLWNEFSPLKQVANDKPIPPCFVTYSRGVSPAGEVESRKAQAEAFKNSLARSRIDCEVFPAIDRTHNEINARFGDVNDNVTQAAQRFLDSHLVSRDRKSARTNSSTGNDSKANGQGPFQLSYSGGGRDQAGRNMGGTELRNLASHKGKLYAGVEMWMDAPGNDPESGAQIMVLDKPDGPWRLDHEFAESLPGQRQRRGQSSKRYEGVTVLESVAFERDSRGKALPEPQNVLLAACRDFLGEANVFSRNDQNAQWIEMQLAANAPRASIRCIGVHRDQVTGVDRVFAGSVPSGIFSGVYDEFSPGKIRWDKQPELANSVLDGRPSRPMAFADCNGELHLAMEPNVYKRIDGPTPTWKVVYSYEPLANASSSGLRGLTAVPNPYGNGESLLAAMEGSTGQIIRIDPGSTYQATVELDVRNYLNQKWGNANRYFVVANNHMTWVPNPSVPAKQSLLISLQIHPAAKSLDAWFFVRHAPGQYEMRRVDIAGLSPDRALCSTRTIVVSPFPEDRGLQVFAGGYDADDRPSHNTAWVAKARVEGLLSPSADPASQQPRTQSTGSTNTASKPATANLPGKMDKAMKAIGTTSEQQKKIVEIVNAHQGNLKDPKLLKQINAILTEEQRIKLNALQKKQQ